MVIGIFVFAFFGQPLWYWLIASRILLLPVIAGLAYELIRFAGKHQDNRILMTLLAPGLWLQRLTTREPTLDQLEVSIRALARCSTSRARLKGVGAQGRGDGVACHGSSARPTSTLGGQISPAATGAADGRLRGDVRRAAV